MPSKTCAMEAQSWDVNCGSLSDKICNGTLNRKIQCVSNAWVQVAVVVWESEIVRPPGEMTNHDEEVGGPLGGW